MAFRFDFTVDKSDDTDEDVGERLKESNEISELEVTNVPETKEVNFSLTKIWDKSKALTLTLSDGSTLLYTDVRHLCSHGDDVNKDISKDNSIIHQTEINHSDLISGVYEGGLKIWECSLDLTEFLVSLNLDFTRLKVLELGCGAALPSLYAGLKGAEIHLHDYNEEVITQVTLPNVQLNSLERCKLYAGDWAKLGDLLNNGSDVYDMILTSETIYNTDSYEKLHNALSELLKPGGEIFVATKTHYFGVGGGSELFKEFVMKKEMFNVETVKQFDEGVKREILKMAFLAKDAKKGT